MKQLTIISGKGGTGKTSITASFAALAKNKVVCDCDVDAADLHLILNPQVIEKEEFYGSKVAKIDENLCNGCGECLKVCRFDAIYYPKNKGQRKSNKEIQPSNNYHPEVVSESINLEIKETRNQDYQLSTFNNKPLIDEISCEGCGVCVRVCPEKAIKLEEDFSGHWFISDTKYGKLVHAKLGIAKENSGKLVSQVRKQAQSIAEKENLDYIIIDGPPGIGCPVIASLGGIDLALIVTEPTISAIHDMERIIGVTRHFNIKSFVCINKCNLNVDKAEEIKVYCDKNDIKLIGKIPFDPVVTKAQVNGKTVVEYTKNNVAMEIKNIWAEIEWNLK